MPLRSMIQTRGHRLYEFWIPGNPITRDRYGDNGSAHYFGE